MRIWTDPKNKYGVYAIWLLHDHPDCIVLHGSFHRKGLEFFATGPLPEPYTQYVDQEGGRTDEGCTFTFVRDGEESFTDIYVSVPGTRTRNWHAETCGDSFTLTGVVHKDPDPIVFEEGYKEEDVKYFGEDQP
jgi:hypothetical protein